MSYSTQIPYFLQRKLRIKQYEMPVINTLQLVKNYQSLSKIKSQQALLQRMSEQ